MGVEILVSRGALRRIAEAEFEQNVHGLRSCITACCAAAFAKRTGDRLEIRAWQLPVEILDAGPALMQTERDNQLVDTARSNLIIEEDPLIRQLDAALDALAGWRAGTLTSHELIRRTAERTQALEDHLLFNRPSSTRVAAFSHVIEGIVDKVNDAHSTSLSRRDARVISEELCLLLWPPANLARWKAARAADISSLLAAIIQRRGFSASVARHLRSELAQALGIELDDLTSLLVTMTVDAAGGAGRRRHIGIILCHGYSTATSIADAANRILGSRVFEAIDMPYDQQVKDILKPLRQLIDRFAYLREIAVLVDMGSLEQIHRDLAGIADASLGIVNNASTGLAVEIGAGLIAGRDIAEILDGASRACVCRYTLVERSQNPEAIVFCAEGADAAEKVLALVSQALDKEPPVHLTACDLRQLRENGAADAIFSRLRVRAIIGTEDPAIPNVPFIALEQLIAGEALSQVERIFSPHLAPDDLARLHRRLIKNLTLRNVMESLTILNPERLLAEIERAIALLQQLAGSHIERSLTIGLHVHLCCLVERLVTRNPIDRYADEGFFATEHADFIEAFRSSFSAIAAHYRVEVPVSEIAYVYDYIHSPRAPRTRASLGSDVTNLQDE